MSRRRSIPSGLLAGVVRRCRRGAQDDPLSQNVDVEVNEGSAPWLIVGLGNPGRRYQATRHNAGFMAVEALARRLPPGTARGRMQAQVLETRDGEARVVLARPQTFMNDSGQAVSQLMRWHKCPLERLLVIYDELDLPFGVLRLRADGSAGGHNGMKSIIQQLGTQQFARLRIGISRPGASPAVPYVLSPFNADERRELPDLLEHAADVAIAWRRDGVTAAMNEHNRRDSPDSQQGAGANPAVSNSAPGI